MTIENGENRTPKMAEMEGPMHASKVGREKKSPGKIWFFFLKVQKSPPRAYYWGQEPLFFNERGQKALILASYTFLSSREKTLFFKKILILDKSMIPLYGLLLEKQKKVCSGLGFFFLSYMQCKSFFSLVILRKHAESFYFSLLTSGFAG